MNLINNNCSPQARRIAEALQEDMHVQDFAKYTAEVLRNEYGSHNFQAFITKLINELDNDTIG
jgi:hypothetical protein